MEMSLYDELSSQDFEALSEVDDGADIVGMHHRCFLSHSVVAISYLHTVSMYTVYQKTSTCLFYCSFYRR